MKLKLCYNLKFDDKVIAGKYFRCTILVFLLYNVIYITSQKHMVSWPENICQWGEITKMLQYNPWT